MTNLAGRLRRLEARRPPPAPALPPLSPEERVARIDAGLTALLARVIDPDTGAPNTAAPAYPQYRRVEELLARAGMLETREEQGRWV